MSKGEQRHCLSMLEEKRDKNVIVIVQHHCVLYTFVIIVISLQSIFYGLMASGECVYVCVCAKNHYFLSLYRRPDIQHINEFIDKSCV